jgi:chromosome segregation ATPase
MPTGEDVALLEAAAKTMLLNGALSAEVQNLRAENETLKQAKLAESAQAAADIMWLQAELASTEAKLETAEGRIGDISNLYNMLIKEREESLRLQRELLEQTEAFTNRAMLIEAEYQELRSIVATISADIAHTPDAYPALRKFLPQPDSAVTSSRTLTISKRPTMSQEGAVDAPATDSTSNAGSVVLGQQLRKRPRLRTQ